jgi:hypothetical protein
MNRFRVKKDSEEAFEQVWLTRDTQLTKVPEIGHGETNSAQSFLVRNTSVSGLPGGGADGLLSARTRHAVGV